MSTRISWLLNNGQPSGRTVMAVRRMAVLADRFDTAGFTLDPPPRMPKASRLRVLQSARGLAGEARLARSDVIVSTSESSVASAVSRARPGARIVHLLHDGPDFLLSTVRFMRSVPSLAHVVVPLSVDPGRFAARAGLDPDRVSTLEDFVGESDSLPAGGRGRVALVAGRLRTAGRAAVDAFTLADLPGWQLRLVGSDDDGLAADVEAAGLRGRVVVTGPSFDVTPHYVDAGVVLALDPSDVNGLSVLEGLAAGVPVLGDARVPAVRRYVRDGHNGVVLDRVDPVAVADGLTRLAALAPDLAANARADRVGLLTPAAARHTHELFARILATPAPPLERR